MKNIDLISNFPEHIASGNPFLIGVSKSFEQNNVKFVFLRLAQCTNYNDAEFILGNDAQLRRASFKVMHNKAIRENWLTSEGDVNFGVEFPQFEIQEIHSFEPQNKDDSPRVFTTGNYAGNIMGKMKSDGTVAPTYSHTKLVLRNTKKDEIWVNAIPLPNSNVGIKEAQSTSSILDTILDNPNPILEEDYNS